jgi:signal transduction histidine kinase
MENAVYPLRDLRRLLTGADYPPPAKIPSRRWLRWRTFVRQAALVTLIGLTVAEIVYLQGTRMDDAASLAIGIASALPALFLHRRPLLAWRVAYPPLWIGAFGITANEPWPWNTVQIIVFLGVLAVLATRADAGVSAWAGILSLMPVFALVQNRANAFGVTVLVITILLLGDQTRRRRLSQLALAEQAERSELEKARRALLEERTRIAREMHDVVAHHMSMIAVQAETAPYRIDAMPEPERGEFAAIAVAAREALNDMRRLLGVLRSESGAPLTAPQPGLADIPELVAAAQRAGVVVRLDAAEAPAGAPVPPAAVALATYRIVQEALANAARHAPGAATTVEPRPGAASLTVRVTNGPSPVQTRPGSSRGAGATAAAGHGLTGMRERARLLGGDFSANPTPDGGFQVTAAIPYAAEATA